MVTPYTYFKGLGGATQFIAQVPTAPIVRQSIPVSVKEYTFAEARESENLLGYEAGEHQPKVVLPGTAEFTLTITSDVQTEQLLAMGRNEVWRAMTTGSIIDVPFKAVVPTGGVVAVPGLQAANSATTTVTIEGGGGVPLEIVTAGPPSAGQAFVEDGQVTLEGSRVGDTVFVAFQRAVASGEMVGGPNVDGPTSTDENAPQTISEFSFAGDWVNDAGDEGIIYIPRLQITTPPEQTMQGGAAVWTIEATALTTPNWPKPFVAYRNLTYS